MATVAARSRIVRVIMVVEWVRRKSERNWRPFLLNGETSLERLCRRYATCRFDLFLLEIEPLTNRKVQADWAQLSRRRDFAVPISKRPNLNRQFVRLRR